MFYVYILRCADGTLYTGVAADPEKRLRKHNAGKGAKYMRGKRLPAKIAWLKPMDSMGDALAEEARIKKLTRKEKEWLLNDARLYETPKDRRARSS